MKIEKILTREDGSKVKIAASFEVGWSGTKYAVNVYTCAPKKRTFVKVDVTNDYQCRALPFASKAREEFELKEILKHVTEEEIYAAKISLWESLKPTK